MKCNNTCAKVGAWNINLATNRIVTIPDFVEEELLIQNFDLFVLTEFCKTKNFKEFCKELDNNGYSYVITNNTKNHNNVLLAWKNDKYDMVEIVNEFTTNETTPNFAYVILKEKNKGIEFAFAGARITIENYENRLKQVKFILDQLKSYDRVVIAGDFNCLRRETLVKEYNISVLAKTSRDYGFSLITPEGQSIYSDKAFCVANEFAEDHFIVRGLDIEDEKYDRSFTLRHRDIYIHGKDFCVYDHNLKRNIWSVEVGSGIPDHALLCGNICF